MGIPPTIRDFQDLIRWLIATYHRGIPYQFARRMKVSHGTAEKWVDGMVQRPTITLLLRLSEVYRLDVAEVVRIASKPPKRPTAIAGGSGQAQPLPGPKSENEVSLIRHWLRAWWERILSCPRRPAFVC